MNVRVIVDLFERGTYFSRRKCPGITVTTKPSDHLFRCLYVLSIRFSFEGSWMVRFVAKIMMRPIRQSLPGNQVERHVLGYRFRCDMA